TAALLSCSSSMKPVPAGPLHLVFVASEDTNTISTFAVDPASDQLSAAGTTPTGACLGPRYLEMHPSNDFVFATCLFSNGVAAFAIDRSSGSLTLVGTPAVTGNAPVGLAVHPKGKFIFVSNINSNSVSVYAVGPGGNLAEISGSPFATGATPYWAEISES